MAENKTAAKAPERELKKAPTGADKKGKKSDYVPKAERESKTSPPAVLVKDGDQVVITLNKFGGVSDVKFTGRAFHIATDMRISKWLPLIKLYAKKARSIDTYAPKAKKKG